VAGHPLIDADGIGASTYHLLVPTLGRSRVRAFKGSARTTYTDCSKVLTFVNVRAAAWWAFREALNSAYGSQLALPPSRELRAELCAARYQRQINGINIEDKQDVKERLGRSPDLADAYVMALWSDSNLFGEALARAYGRPREPEPRPPEPVNPHPIADDRAYRALLEKYGIRLDDVED
jgi:hypothetical protein